jgi:catechol-2,3-dioxygenase
MLALYASRGYGQMAIARLGHVGIYAKDMDRMRAFYRDMLGLQVSDEGPNTIFMSADPEREHHEFVLVRAQNEEQRTSVQQISFVCEKIDDIVNYYHRFKDAGVRFRNVTSHGNAVGLYFFDPEDNVCEVYWPTPWKAHQPYGVAVDLTQPLDQILASIEADVKIHGATGHADPDSFKLQREQFEAQGIRV